MKKYNKEQYQQGKEKARNKAIEWQYSFQDQSYSWYELSMIEAHFKELGKHYGLLKEFHENGIC